MKNLVIISVIIIAIIATSCSINKSIITENESANYTNWIGGQEGIGGTNFVFKVISNTNDRVTLDSIYIDNIKIERWEQNRSENSIIIKASINYNNNNPISINSSNKSITKNIKNPESFSRAKLFFSSDKKIITIVFDKIIKMDNNYYP
ncbi:MAG: hypothetical protein KAG37_05220 [Flavobacteriales bacterium]|nr:hypothetical protein [Flavobacteriales bacterium]